MPFKLTVNGRPLRSTSPADMPLLWVLRDVLNLKGTKYGCGIGQCGACTVHLGGKAVRSCLTPVSAAAQRADHHDRRAFGRRHASVQLAWQEIDVPQCGYCQAGQMMSAAALLAKNAAADRRGHRRGDERQHLPLRHLSAHPPGDSQGRRRSGAPARSCRRNCSPC